MQKDRWEFLGYVLIDILAGIAGALFHSVIASSILGSGHVILIGASGAISGVLGILALPAGNTRAYYWLMLQIVFAVFGSIASIPIAFTAHIGGFIAGVFLTKLFVTIERNKRAKYLRSSGNNNYDNVEGRIVNRGDVRLSALTCSVNWFVFESRLQSRVFLIYSQIKSRKNNRHHRQQM